MRIISQNGEINLPFELTVVLSGGNDIVARLSGEAKERVYVMASYSSVEKRRKAMKMLDGSYTGKFVYQYFTNGTKPKHMTFRFPKDDEI